jgi:hypothetical protein
MAASVALAVDAALVAAFAAANASLSSSPDRISVYRALIPGVPTNRYCVIYAGNPNRQNSTVDGLSRDGVGRFQVTCAATAPDTGQAAALCDWLVTETLDALVDQSLTVDGWQPFIVQQDLVDTFPISVEVVTGRDTVEQALWFVFLTDRI